MIQSDDTTRITRAVLANLVAVVGVAVLDWSVTALLLVYWIESGVAIARGLFQGLFAQREPGDTAVPSLPGGSWSEKRGGVSLGPLPPIYPRNVHVVFSGIVVLVLFWPVVGGVVALAADSTAGGVPVWSVGVAIIGVFISNGVAVVDYVRSERYTNCTARSAVPQRYVLGVFLFGIGGLYALEQAAAPPVVFAAAAAAKLLVDLFVTGFEPDDGLGDWADEPLDEHVPAGEPAAVFRTDRRALSVRALGLVPLYLIAPPYTVFPLAAGIVGLAFGLGAGVATLGVAAAVVTVGRLVGASVEYGHLEYRVYSNRIVAYDTLLDTTQWTVRPKTVEDITLTSSVFDSVLPGGTTVVVSMYDEERRLYALDHPEAFVETVGG